jgi:hypothetical protein
VRSGHHGSSVNVVIAYRLLILPSPRARTIMTPPRAWLGFSAAAAVPPRSGPGSAASVDGGVPGRMSRVPRHET